MCILCGLTANGQVEDPGTAAKEGASQHDNNNIDNGVDKGLNKAEGAIKGLYKKKNKAKQEPATTTTQPAVQSSAAAGQPGSNISVYQNYDIEPGDKILFTDDFTYGTDGEFPPHWELVNGQATTNRLAGYESFVITDGNYARVKPRMKVANYLPNQFTVEFDTYFQKNAYGFMAMFNQAKSGADEDALLTLGQASVQYECAIDNYSLTGNLPATISEDNYTDYWHHIALAYRDKQLKAYVDQYRVLTIPDMHLAPANMHFGGLASQEGPLIFRNVKIAAGGGMNMLGKKFTDAKIITHGINFDIDKAVILPQSMGVLNDIKTIMTDNPDLKFEIDGHTDNTGGAAHNLTLSQQRADAV